MPNFIKDDLLKLFAQEVITKTVTATTKAELALHSNILDPFSALYDSQIQGIDLKEWLEQEKIRQIQKTLQNAIGDFHQNVLGSVEGWHNPGRGGGYDIIGKEHKVIAEIKNKFNTMNSSSAESTYRKLSSFLESEEYTGYTAYVVFVVPKRPIDFNEPWSPNIEKMPLRKDLRKIDGESFYKLVTGKADALLEVFEATVNLIPALLDKSVMSDVEKSLFIELFKRAYK